ncbi:MAG: DUF1194 domain-containing protein [Rhodomicrobium sp.]|nr:DUF1194 domain-containing protein [Rhodomicrobium sp.]
MFWRLSILFCLFAVSGAADRAQAEDVDLELVLLADSSGSIDDAETAFQRQGYAGAITHPDVVSAIRAGLLQRIAVTYVEWGDSRHQDVVVPWTIIDGVANKGERWSIDELAKAAAKWGDVTFDQGLGQLMS